MMILLGLTVVWLGGFIAGFALCAYTDRIAAPARETE